MKSTEMELQSSKDKLVRHILEQMIESCGLIMKWNENITSADYYPTSPDGLEKMAATCMLIETIGEGVKKIDKMCQGDLYAKSPDVPWKQIAGLRDHIAHGYFNLDAEIIFDVVKNEIPVLQEALVNIKSEY